MLNKLKNIFKQNIVTGQKGFTLIELLAVMAIVGTLAGIVSTSVSGTSSTSKNAAARQDASTLTSSGGDFFSDQSGAEVLTPSSVTVIALFNDESVVPTDPSEQITSSRWPETGITEELPDLETAPTTPYTNEFPSEFSDTNGLVLTINIRGKTEADGTAGADISRTELLTGYTAVDFDALVDGGYAEAAPESSVQTTEALGENFHNYLWLFKKSSTSGSTTDDSRVIVLFRLSSAEIFDTSPKTLDLTYEQIH